MSNTKISIPLTSGEIINLIFLSEVTSDQQEVLDFVLGVRKYIGVKRCASDFSDVWFKPIESDKI